MTRIARFAFIGIVAFALIVGTPLSAQAGRPLTRVEHPNVLVTLDPESSSQNEVTIAAFPNNRNVLVATARDTRQASGFSWAGYYRSTDGGDTWQNALVPGFPGDTSPEGLASPVHDAGWKIGSDPVITADRDGRVYLAWLSFGPTTTEFAGWLVLTRYSNFGATYDFTSVVFAGHDTPSDKLGGPGNSRVTDKEWIAVDDTGGTCDGNVYIPWAFFEGSHGTKIVLHRSTDRGLSWSPPSRVNDVTTNHQIFPAITTFRGRVDVSFYDSRNDPEGKLLDIYYAQSNDDGLTFLPNVRVTDAAFDPNLGVTGGGAAFLGDYNGIASNAAGAHPIWADNCNVSINSLRDQDIYTATIS